MNEHALVPGWLLIELGLLEGTFTEGGTAVVGRPDAHNSAVLNVANGPPATITVHLKRRSDWEEIKQKLESEGQSKAGGSTSS